MKRPTKTNSPRSRARCIILALAATLASGTSSAAQDSTPAANPFSDTVDVRVINVEVVVTDRDGIRVHGLESDDFRLEVDGAQRPIDYFAEVRGGEIVGTDASSSRATRSLLGGEIGDTRGTSYLVFIDNYFSVAADRNRVLQGMERDLEMLGSEDRMAVVSFDGTGVKMLAPWTRSREELAQVLAGARNAETHGLNRRAELRTHDRQLGDRWLLFQQRPLRTQLTGLERNYALRLASQVERSVRAASATMRGFAFPPGRKVLLLLSGGWPFSPAGFAANTYLSSFAGTLETGVPGRSRLYEPLTSTANLLGYTLYPVDVPGLEGDGRTDVTRSLPPPVIGDAFDREEQVEHSLIHLAGETGGRALLDGRSQRPLRPVAQDVRSYYWLGFSLQRGEDDERHDIDVELQRPSLKVRAREGFVDLSRARELDLVVESALLFGNPPSDERLEVRTGRSVKTGPRRAEMPLEIGIPISEMFLIEEGGAHRTRLDLRLQAIGPDGAISETVEREIEIREQAEPRDGQIFWYETILKMRPRTERVVVAVRDPVGGAVLSSVLEIDS